MPEDDLVGVTLPSGVRNFRYGIWRSHCCGDEIVLYRGAIFPVCHRHKHRLTEWTLISTDLLTKPDLHKLASRQNTSEVIATIQHVLQNRLRDLSTGDAVSSETECAHLMTCPICRSTFERLVSEYRNDYRQDRPKSA